MAPAAENQYSNAIVSLVDLLGFSELVRSSASPEPVLAALSAFRSHTVGHPSVVRSVGHAPSRWFYADTLVRVLVVDSENKVDDLIHHLHWELRELRDAQINLLREGILLRGAVTVGAIHARDREIFGPALIRAHEIESRIADFPRIVLDAAVFERLKTNEAAQSLLGHHVKLDSGIAWLDYLNSASIEFYDPYKYGEFLAEHRALLEALRSKVSNSRAREKLQWVEDYHDATVRRYASVLSSKGYSHISLLLGDELGGSPGSADA